jgi:MFS-type transporter involved in bile tolerance (Atg22 family)
VLKTLHIISSLLLTALGTVHTVLTPVFYGRFSLSALWFAGSGLTMIFLGFLNIALSRAIGRDRLVQILCHVANLITTVFGILLVTVDSEPQVIFGLVLIVLMTVTAFMLRGART